MKIVSTEEVQEELRRKDRGVCGLIVVFDCSKGPLVVQSLHVQSNACVGQSSSGNSQTVEEVSSLYEGCRSVLAFSESPEMRLDAMLWRYHYIAGPPSVGPLLHQALRNAAKSSPFHILLINVEVQVLQSLDSPLAVLDPLKKAKLLAILAASQLPVWIGVVGGIDGLSNSLCDTLAAQARSTAAEQVVIGGFSSGEESHSGIAPAAGYPLLGSLLIASAGQQVMEPAVTLRLRHFATTLPFLARWLSRCSAKQLTIFNRSGRSLWLEIIDNPLPSSNFKGLNLSLSAFGTGVKGGVDFYQSPERKSAPIHAFTVRHGDTNVVPLLRISRAWLVVKASSDSKAKPAYVTIAPGDAVWIVA